MQTKATKILPRYGNRQQDQVNIDSNNVVGINGAAGKKVLNGNAAFYFMLSPGPGRSLGERYLCLQRSSELDFLEVFSADREGMITWHFV